MIETIDKIVIYLDILGFAQLTLENELDIEAIKDFNGPMI